ncbi:RNA polymerase II transcription regulator recruiting protein [Trichomonas vaginalis G3]|uniref:RNA polymerase II transcription regulator recruiting protein n=1 Tax=Trichomonas vaginalis (strain ATCC PRA-98 / G3) TaxID=412133 RepID=UPI0021E59805|nr:RNA polymerase II transcription regulator recruiting protein [Trichomonas vaginalis G3]KAI5490439.1 RNA polymerase II transcription regulator recruiting protein [Trichomonas vaginalis G3]
MAHCYVPKIKFTPQEDQILTNLVQKYGPGDWDRISRDMKNRTPRQCRERWINYISPELSNDPWTQEEDQLLDELYSEYGSRWHKIAEFFPNRSGNCVRNRYKLRQRRAQRQAAKEIIKQPKRAKPISQPQPMSSIISIKSNDDFSEIFNIDKIPFEEFFNSTF